MPIIKRDTFNLLCRWQTLRISAKKEIRYDGSEVADFPCSCTLFTLPRDDEPSCGCPADDGARDAGAAMQLHFAVQHRLLSWRQEERQTQRTEPAYQGFYDDLGEFTGRMLRMGLVWCA